MNPRRPTPAGPKPAPFDLARAPPPKMNQQKTPNKPYIEGVSRD